MKYNESQSHSVQNDFLYDFGRLGKDNKIVFI